MNIEIDQLQEGCILSKHVYSVGQHPLILKNTVINSELIEVLKAFFIKHVEVELYLENGERFIPDYILSDEIDSVEDQAFNEDRFSLLFHHALNEHEKMFNNWKSGAPVDGVKIREILIPIIDYSIENNDVLNKMNKLDIDTDSISFHSISVAIFSTVLAYKIGYQKSDIIQIAIGGCLSDCGMAKVSESILRKSTPLTEKEFNEIKQHPIHSYKMVKNVKLITEAVKISVLQHHERIDGSGYPLGVKMDQFHPYCKIITLADTYQAMRSDRNYRTRLSSFQVLEKIIYSEFGRFDLATVEVLKKALTSISTGSKIKLSNGEIAEVVFIEEQNPTRPIVKLVDTNEIITLKDHKNLYIEESY